MPLKSLVSSLLNKYLGKYIDNLDSKNLELSIFSGDLELRDLQLKPEALAELDLPIEVKTGYIGYIKVDVQWTKLFQSTIAVTVEDVYLLASPIAERPYDPVKEHILENASKRQKLDSLNNSLSSGDDEEPGMLDNLTASIMNNLQVSVKNIHVRYEDTISNPGHPFACGIMLKSMVAHTTDLSGKPTTVDDNTNIYDKSVALDGLSAYWNPNVSEQNLVKSRTTVDGWRTLLKNAIESHSILMEDLDFLLQPVSAQPRLIVNKDANFVRPKFFVDFRLDELELLLSRQQFLNMLCVQDSMTMLAVNQQYRKYHPNVPLKVSPKAWWHYAYKCVVEEYIRPYSWTRIKAHRTKYREYKSTYKQWLGDQSNDGLKTLLYQLEDNLDVVNILLAREHAKIEFAHANPESARPVKKETGWFDWLFGTEDTEDEMEVDATSEDQNWLAQLSTEEKEKLYSDIGFDINANPLLAPRETKRKLFRKLTAGMIDKTGLYVKYKIQLNLTSCSLELINCKTILQLSASHCLTTFESRPTSGFRISGNMESFSVEGASIENELIPVLTSDVGVYVPSVNQVFTVDFEQQPLYVDADYSVKLNVQPVEIIYDEHSLSEVLAFFQVQNNTTVDLASAAMDTITGMGKYSRAGLQYAIEQHKTFHVAINCRSPYIVIPEHGTLHRGGNVLVLDMGTLRVNSDLQSKDISLEDATMSEIESRLYDQFNINVADVKVLLADSGDDWHTAQTQPDSPYHILPSVSLGFTFFNAVKPDYKELPQQKFVAHLPTLKLCISDHRFLLLASFFSSFPVPTSASMITIGEDNIDGMTSSIGPTALACTLVKSEAQHRASVNDLRIIHKSLRIKLSHSINTALGKVKKKLKTSTDDVDSGTQPQPFPEGKSDAYFSASDHSDEDIDELFSKFEVKGVDDHSSETNTSRMLFRLTIGGVVIQLSRFSDRKDTPYLMLRLDRACLDAAVTVHGIVVQASLGGLQLVDKIHIGPSGEYLELFNSKSGNNLISITYRQVSPKCPDFLRVYKKMEHGLYLRFECLDVNMDRDALLYLMAFGQNIMNKLQNLDTKTSMMSVASVTSDTADKDQPRSMFKTLLTNIDEVDNKSSSGVIHLSVIAKLSEVNIKLTETDKMIGELNITGFNGQLLMMAPSLTVRCSLSGLSVEDHTEGALYPRILRIEDDKVFDLKFVKYNKGVTESGENRTILPCLDYKVRLRIGAIQFTFLNRFLWDVTRFVEPFISRETTETAMDAAIDTVQKQIGAIENENLHMQVSVDIRAPTVLIPQNSQCMDAFRLKLGDLNVSNIFEHTVMSNIDASQEWNHFFIRLDSVQINRCRLSQADETLHICHAVLEPISLALDVKKAMLPLVADVEIDVTGHLNLVKVNLMKKDVQILWGVMDENLQEGAPSPSPAGVFDLGPSSVDVPTSSSVTPVLEHGESLPNTKSSASSIKVNASLKGLTLVLWQEHVLGGLMDEDDETSRMTSISKLEMTEVDFRAAQYVDGAKDAHITLQAINIDDVRPNSNVVMKKIFQHMSGPEYGESRKPPIIDLAYKVTNDGIQTIDFKIERFRLNLHIPYILLLLDFVRGTIYQPHKTKVPDTSPSDANDGTKDGAMTIYGKVKEPEIVLFIQPELKESQVLVFRADFDFEYGVQPHAEHMSAKLSHLQLVTCVYARPDQTTTKVILPCSMDFSRVFLPDKGKLEMIANLPQFDAHLSAAIIKMFFTLKAMLPEWDTEQGRSSPDGSSVEGRLYKNLWGVSHVTADKWLHDKADSGRKPISVIPTHLPSEVLKVNIPQVNVYFDVLTKDNHQPIVCVQTSLEAEVNDWSKQLHLKCEFHLEMCYFNEKVHVWEPLIEPMMVKENVYRPWEVLCRLVQAESHPIACSYEESGLDVQDSISTEIRNLMQRAKNKSSSSETEDESETDMTVIRNRILGKKRHGSDRSFDSLSHHSSIQGESDSEPEEFVNNITNELGRIFSTTDSSDADVSEMEDNDEACDLTLDKPVFITSQGLVDIDTGENLDTVDSPNKAEEGETTMCNYMFIHSRDALQFNVTPQAVSVLKDVMQAMTEPDSSELTDVQDLPALEIINQLGVATSITLHPDMKYNADYVSGCEIIHSGDMPQPTTSQSSPDSDIVILDPDNDDSDQTDGLAFLEHALAISGNALISAGAFVFDDDDDYTSGEAIDKDRLRLSISGFYTSTTILHKRACHKLIALTPKQSDDSMELENSARYCVVMDVDMQHGRKIITIYSPLQLENTLTVPVDVFCKTEDLKLYPMHNLADTSQEYSRIASIEPNQIYHVPLLVAYHCSLYVCPADLGYEKTFAAIWWQDLIQAKEKTRYFTCLSNNHEQKDFYFKVNCKEGPSLRPSQSVPTPVPYYTIQLHSPVIVHNYLPYDVQFTLRGSQLSSSLTPGDTSPLYTVDPQKAHKLSLQVTEYLSCAWSGNIEISQDMEEFKAVTMETDNEDNMSANKHLSLNVHANTSRGSLDLYIYSPYWIINKSGLLLQLKGSSSDMVTEVNNTPTPLLIRFKKNRRKKAKLRVFESRWSHSFSLDTVGTSGVVICLDKQRNRKYQFLVQMQLSYMKLTKIVTVMPYFLVVNHSSLPLRYMEENPQNDLWCDLPIGSCLPFWPITDTYNMYVKYETSALTSQHFPIRKQHSTVLRMENGTAVCVEVMGGTETPVTITLSDYQPGDSPVRVENLCEDVFIKIHQKNQSQVTLLSPNQSILYTWDDPTAERTVMWNVYGRKRSDFPAFITKDGYGDMRLAIQSLLANGLMTDVTDAAEDEGDSSPEDFSDDPDGPMSGDGRLLGRTRTDKVVIHWISYLDGQQRVLLFTQDERVLKQARMAHVQGIDIPYERGMAQLNQAEQTSMVFFASVEGMSVSVINSQSEEVLFASASSAPALWEVLVNGRWKMLNAELAAWLEDKWKNGQPRASLRDQIEADLEQMSMTKPFQGSLRRTYYPGLWLQYRTSEHHTAIHAKVQRIQIDNQLSDAYFPTVFYPSPTPHYMIKKTGLRPFIEFAVMRRTVPENNVDTFRYLKMLVQEFNIRVDKGFLLSVLDVWTQVQSDQGESFQLETDLKLARRSMQEIAQVLVSSRPHRIYYEYLHLSPLKLRMSFSLSGTAHVVDKPRSSLGSDIVDFFLTSVGVTFTEMKEVELRMAYFEKKGVMLSSEQLMNQIKSHYVSQAIQQAYVLVLGLDVLGNPYGLIRDFTQGLGDFFYEPLLGSIHGSDEFAESLVRGVQSLVGNTVGGATGSVALITGSLGRALAVLSFDEDFKKKRQLRMQQQPRNIPESLVIAGKSFVMGVVLGLSGIVVSPYKGAQEEGVEGFFKGIGKGLLGLLTKPTGGIIDMVSVAFDGLRRAVELDDGVVARLRPPRFINTYMGLKPFSYYQALGLRLLCSVNKGQYVKTDIYWAHAPLSKDDRADVVLITDNRILLLEKCRFWSDWSVDWQVSVDSMLGIPAITEGKLVFKTKRHESVSGGNLFVGEDQEISSPDGEVLVWLQKKLQHLHNYRDIL